MTGVHGTKTDLDTNNTETIFLIPQVDCKTKLFYPQIKTLVQQNKQQHMCVLPDKCNKLTIFCLHLIYIASENPLRGRVTKVCMYVRTYIHLSYDPYGPASAFFAKPLMKVPYEGRTHLRERGRKKPYGPTTKAYGLAC